MPQSFASLHFHIVFSTRRREPRLGMDLHPRLYEYVGGILRTEGCSLTAAGGMPDHVHLLVSLGREASVSGIVRLIKSNSSGWLHETLKRPDIGWQDGYGAFSVSQSNLDSVRAYLHNQAEHHRKLSFKEEFLALLERHGLSWDERYVWD